MSFVLFHVFPTFLASSAEVAGSPVAMTTISFEDESGRKTTPAGGSSGLRGRARVEGGKVRWSRETVQEDEARRECESKNDVSMEDLLIRD